MKRNLGVTEVREKLGELVEQVQYRGVAFLISRHGKPAAAIVPVEVYESWYRQRAEFFAAIHKIQDANPELDPDEVMQDVLATQQRLRSSE